MSGYDNDVSLFDYEMVEDGSGMLHYYYQWKGLEFIAVGFVKAVAENIFDISIEMEVVAQKEKKYNNGNKYYVCFSVKGKLIQL